MAANTVRIAPLIPQGRKPGLPCENVPQCLVMHLPDSNDALAAQFERKPWLTAIRCVDVVGWPGGEGILVLTIPH